MIFVALCVLAAAAVSSAQSRDINVLSADQVWQGIQPGSRAGTWLDIGALSAGDNRRDLVIGSPGGPGVFGTLHVIYGGPVRQGAVSLQHSDALIRGEALGDLFGTSSAVGNILSLEGTDPKNLVVGAPAASGGRGAVYLFPGPFGAADSQIASAAVLKIIGRPGDQIGTMLATADLNNDGYREIVIGAPGNHRVYVIRGGPALSGTMDLGNPATPAPAMTVDIPAIGSVLTAGDVNGDGIQDLFIGAPAQNIVYAFAGQTGSFPVGLAAVYNGIDVGDLAGASLRLGDLDADGKRDLIIGAPGAAGPGNGRPGSGEAYVIWGGAGALTSRSLSSADVTFYGAAAGDHFGAGISTGDVNRDTPNDAVFLADGAASGSGILSVYYGRPRTDIGTALPDGRRVVDFAVEGQVNRRIGSGPNVGTIRSVQVFEVTGEGARDIIVGVPSTETNTGSIYFTLSPKMVPSSTSVSIVAQRDTSKQVAMQVANVAPIPITFTATSDRPWLTASTSGTAVDATPGSLTITANAAGLAPGTYTGTIALTSTSVDLTMQLPITVSFTVTQTMIALDSPIHNSTVSQPFNIGGWALDLGSASDPGIDTIHIWAFPVAGGDPIFLAEAHTGGARPDVGAAFGPQFNNSGFNLQVTGLAPARYIIALYVHNARTGTFDASVGAWVTVLSSASMVIDTHRDGAVLNPNFYVAGWAIDAAAKTGTGVDAIHVWAIPQNGGPNKFLGVATYGDPRPDLGNAFGARFTNSGWHLNVTGLAPGLYTIAVYAHSTVSGSFTDSRGFTATVLPSGRMSLDSPAPNSTVPHKFLVAGWAIDLAATSGTGVDTVHVWATPVAPGSAGQFIGVASYGASRPDVGAAVGNHQFDNCGFNLLVNSGASGTNPLAAGTYTISVYGHTISSGFSLIQTRVVTVQ